MDIQEFEYSVLKMSLGDVLVIRIDRFPSAEETMRIRESLPYQNSVIFLPIDGDISVIKAEDHG